MPDYLRCLIVILSLAIPVFLVAKASASASAIAVSDFDRRRNVWIFLTVVVFLCGNYWVYIVTAAVALIWTATREKNRLAAYFFLLFAVPGIPGMIEVPGIGNIFVIEYYRLLALTLLLPAYLSLRKREGVAPFGRLSSDKFLLAYLVYQLALIVSGGGSVGESLRHGILYPFLGAVLPYYVASRSLRSLAEFRDALMSFSVAAMVLGAIGGFEFLRHWLLYTPLETALGARWTFGSYLMRGDALRAVASAGQSIPLGYAIMVAIGFFLYLRVSIPQPKKWHMGLILLAVGLVAPLSRGPWVGAVAMVFVFVLFGPAPVAKITRLAIAVAVSLPILMLTPAINYIPWIGTVDEHNVDYRANLLARSTDLILRNPFFGTTNYMETEEMQSLATGNGGYTDVVSTYIGIGLAQGLVGLFFFTGVFVTAIYGAARGLSRAGALTEEWHLLGRALIAVLVAVLIVIGTVSSITVIPIIYWVVAGLGVAYAQILANKNVSQISEGKAEKSLPVPEGNMPSSRLRGQKFPRGTRTCSPR